MSSYGIIHAPILVFPQTRKSKHATPLVGRRGAMGRLSDATLDEVHPSLSCPAKPALEQTYMGRTWHPANLVPKRILLVYPVGAKRA